VGGMVLMGGGLLPGTTAQALATTAVVAVRILCVVLHCVSSMAFASVSLLLDLDPALCPRAKQHALARGVEGGAPQTKYASPQGHT